MELTREIRDERIAIARDVNARLDAKLLRSERGSFITRRNFSFQLPSDRDTPALSVLDDIERNCSVCAQGAIMLSWVRRHNGWSVQDLFGSYVSTCDDSPIPCFESIDLNLIEAAFEQIVPFGKDDARSLAACDFGKRYRRSNDRLHAIMDNIIANDGVFGPNQEFVIS